MNKNNVNHAPISSEEISNESRYQKPAQRTVQAVIPNSEDLDVINQAAQSCGMSISGFTRFHVLKAARQIMANLEQNTHRVN
nr:MAG TPA: N-acetyltransferase [Caudoviricetes sp.]